MVGPWTSDEGISHELNWAAEELETIRRLVPRAQGVAAYRTALSALTAESNEQLFRLVEESSLAFERGDHAPLDLAETRRITAATRQRQLGKTRPRLLPSDRAFLAALLHRIPRDVGASRVPGNRVMVAYLDAGDKPGAAVRRGARRPGRGRRGVGEPPGRHPRHHDNQGRERGRNTRVHRRSTRQASRSSSPSG